MLATICAENFYDDGPSHRYQKGSVLVELQIDTLRQEGRLSDYALIEYHARSEKITELYHEIDRVVRARFDWRSVRAS